MRLWESVLTVGATAVSTDRLASSITENAAVSSVETLFVLVRHLPDVCSKAVSPSNQASQSNRNKACRQWKRRRDDDNLLMRGRRCGCDENHKKYSGLHLPIAPAAWWLFMKLRKSSTCFVRKDT
ncbi:hypothetical protein DFP92_10112 [Yoonia sediminilitoris]|uniref:Uncharacterized protein n=1 Tax=Yoonia sediminilitoris TaxID=1286148 RepID=A0A2T6KPH6_9RHOB|nr:hypothetical protein C8N45_10112 [Yoonia sediminilitoris]RCW98596.1 hypothetical protein DFP92_10112 [Yoonia sediminilitoris]